MELKYMTMLMIGIVLVCGCIGSKVPEETTPSAITTDTTSISTVEIECEDMSRFNRASGCKYMKILEPSIVYTKDGSLEYTFLNLAMDTISKVKIKFTGDCKDTITIDSIQAGDKHKISLDKGSCAIKNCGDEFETSVSITYKKVVGGEYKDYTDSGIIKGRVG